MNTKVWKREHPERVQEHNRRYYEKNRGSRKRYKKYRNRNEFNPHYFVDTERFHRNWINIAIYMEKLNGSHVEELYKAFFDATHPEVIETSEAGNRHPCYGNGVFVPEGSGPNYVTPRPEYYKVRCSNKRNGLHEV